MAIIRQKRTGTQKKAEPGLKKENGQTKSKLVRKKSVLASKLRRTPLGRGRRNADAKEIVLGTGQRNLRKERNLGKERNQRQERKKHKASRSQMMYWLKRRNDNAEDRQFFLPPRQRYRIAKVAKVELVFWNFLMSSLNYHPIIQMSQIRKTKTANQVQEDSTRTFPSSLCILGNPQ